MRALHPWPSIHDTPPCRRAALLVTTALRLARHPNTTMWRNRPETEPSTDLRTSHREQQARIPLGRGNATFLGSSQRRSYFFFGSDSFTTIPGLALKAFTVLPSDTFHT